MKKWTPFPKNLDALEPEPSEQLVEKINKKKFIKWTKKDERWIMNKKKFNIFIYKVSNRTEKMFLGNKAPNEFWEMASGRVSDISWQVAEQGDKVLFQALRFGNPFSNIFAQSKKETKGTSW
jgi:hypothetical protein